MSDKTIECGKIFIFSEKEQEFFKSMNFNDPKKCKKCKKLLREANLYWKGV